MACIAAGISVHIGLTTRVLEAEQDESDLISRFVASKGRKEGVLGRGQIAQHSRGLDTVTQVWLADLAKQLSSYHITSQLQSKPVNSILEYQADIPSSM